MRSGRKIESTDSTNLTGGLRSHVVNHSDILIREWKRRRNGIWGLGGKIDPTKLYRSVDGKRSEY